MARNPHIWVQFCTEYNHNPPSPAALSGSIFLQFFTISSPAPTPRLQFISYFDQSTAAIIQVLIAFLQLKYLGSDDQSNSPFATHPTSMRVAVCSSVSYYLAYIALLRFPLPPFSRHFLVSSGYASVASLASVLLPDSFTPFVYSVFVALSASELLYSLYRRVLVAQFEVRRFFNYIWRSVSSYGGGQQQQMLPL